MKNEWLTRAREVGLAGCLMLGLAVLVFVVASAVAALVIGVIAGWLLGVAAMYYDPPFDVR